jgi:hypothetical protein
MSRKIIFFIIIFFSIAEISFAVPESGIWHSGGIGNYSLLSIDSISASRIQLQKEKVLIQLYPGFAVVKATYWINNTTNDTITIKSGFPVNSEYDGNYQYKISDKHSYYNGQMAYQLCKVFFEDSYSLKIIADGDSAKLSRDTITTEPNASTIQEWYIWKNTFLPHRVSKIEIYSIVETNNSEMTDSWSKSSSNVFVYILQSGLFRKAPIESGDIAIQFMEETNNNIHGIAPDNLFQIDETNTICYYHFSNFIPADNPNIVLSYGKSIDYFDFSGICNSSSAYFSEIDKIDIKSCKSLRFKPFHPGNPFDFDSEIDDPILQFLLIIVVVLALIIFIILGVVGVFKPKTGAKKT